jgi:hypothetical protein
MRARPDVGAAAACDTPAMKTRCRLDHEEME